MTTPTATVRAWAKDEGLEVSDRGRLGPEVWAAYASAHADAPETAQETEPGAIEVDTAAEPAMPAEEATEPQDTRKEETPPIKPARERAWQKWARKTSEPRPKERRARKRVSLELLASAAWQGVAGVVTSLAGPAYAPVGMMMAFQAPVAGAIIEDAAKDTVADKVLQPVARLVQPGGQVGALLGAPMVTAVICRYPQMYPRLRPILGYAMREYVAIAGPKLREMRRKEEKVMEEMSAFSDEFGMTVDQFLDTVFSPISESLAGAAA